MSNIEFKNLKELYNRIEPALYSKVQELKRNKITFVKEEDIWNYLSANEWQKSDSLSLAEMVNNIFDLNESDIKTYVLSILDKQERIIKTDNLYKESEEGTLL